MQATIQVQDEYLIVTGKLDFTSVMPIWTQSLPLLAKRQNLIFDLSNVTASNSAGLALLLEWVKYAKRENKTIEFLHIPQYVIALAGAANMRMLIQPSASDGRDNPEVLLPNHS